MYVLKKLKFILMVCQQLKYNFLLLNKKMVENQFYSFQM